MGSFQKSQSTFATTVLNTTMSAQKHAKSGTTTTTNRVLKLSYHNPPRPGAEKGTDMNTGRLEQGQRLSAVGTPDYNGEGARPFAAGRFGCASITVTQLAGPSGWYDCAEIEFDNELPNQIIPLHQCDYIAL